jgi:hypothetical protein
LLWSKEGKNAYEWDDTTTEALPVWTPEKKQSFFNTSLWEKSLCGFFLLNFRFILEVLQLLCHLIHMHFSPLCSVIYLMLLLT